MRAPRASQGAQPRAAAPTASPEHPTARSADKSGRPARDNPAIAAALVILTLALAACTGGATQKAAPPTSQGAARPTTLPGKPATTSTSLEASHGGWKLSVLSVVDQYKPAAAIPTGNGMRFLEVEVSLTNNAATPQAFLPISFHVQDKTGHQYLATPFGTLRPPNAALNTGDTLKGTLVFQVPQSESGLDLVYLPNASAVPTILPLD